MDNDDARERLFPKKRPAMHTQEVAFSLPALAVVNPSPHGTHSDASPEGDGGDIADDAGDSNELLDRLVMANLPRGQLVHSLCPAVSATRPAGQTWQSDEASPELRPMEQFTQALASWSPAGIVPLGQGLQANVVVVIVDIDDGGDQK